MPSASSSSSHYLDEHRKFMTDYKEGEHKREIEELEKKLKTKNLIENDLR